MKWEPLKALMAIMRAAWMKATILSQKWGKKELIKPYKKLE
jgi:hypothetical protein